MNRSYGYGSGVWWAVVALVLVGCSPSEVKFRGNLAYVHKQEKSDKDGKLVPFGERLQLDIANILLGQFGTPDKPQLPTLPGVELSKVVDLQKIQMSAGAVKSDKSGSPVGLYREHCVHCHGITGDGLGPTAAFLNPYPRDYRKGIFKFKSTKLGQRPSHTDLTRILLDGIPGTAMPSFNVLDKDEIESLVHYVRYLAIRGEVERQLIEEVSFLGLGDKDHLIDFQDKAELTERMARINEITAGVVQKWLAANGQSVLVPARPAEWNSDPKALTAAIKHGRELFFGKIANCFSCHGDSSLGDGQTALIDEWTKELEWKNELTPAQAERVHEYVSVGALPPRNIRPRNLRLGNYRGGRRPIDLYWRITNGIDGSGMPAAPQKIADDEKSKGLTPEDVWCLIEYVRQLPYETMSQLDRHAPTNARDRN